MLRVTVQINKSPMLVHDQFLMTGEELDRFDELMSDNKNVLVYRVEELTIWSAEHAVKHIEELIDAFSK